MGETEILRVALKDARRIATEIDDRARRLEDVSCRQQNEIASLRAALGEALDAWDDCMGYIEEYHGSADHDKARVAKHRAEFGIVRKSRSPRGTLSAGGRGTFESAVMGAANGTR